LEENIKEDDKVEFIQSLSELAEVEQPTGEDEKEKMNNFVAKQKAKVVVKAVFSYKLKKDDTFRNEIEAEMENKKDSKEQHLDEKVYPKKDGKYTKEAMVQYLFEKKTGQMHQFAITQSQQEVKKD